MQEKKKVDYFELKEIGKRVVSLLSDSPDWRENSGDEEYYYFVHKEDTLYIHCYPTYMSIGGAAWNAISVVYVSKCSYDQLTIHSDGCIEYRNDNYGFLINRGSKVFQNGKAIE